VAQKMMSRSESDVSLFVVNAAGFSRCFDTAALVT